MYDAVHAVEDRHFIAWTVFFRNDYIFGNDYTGKTGVDVSA